MLSFADFAAPFALLQLVAPCTFQNAEYHSPLGTLAAHAGFICCREAKQKRKRGPASVDLPHKTKQRRSLNDSLPAGTSEAAPGGPPDRGYSKQWASPWGTSASGSASGAATVHSDLHRGQSDNALQGNPSGQPFSNGPSARENDGPVLAHAAEGLPFTDHAPETSHAVYPYTPAGPHSDNPVFMTHALTGGQPAGAAHDLNRMVDHMAGHLHNPADEAGAEAEDEEATEDEGTDSDGKQSQVDVVN